MILAIVISSASLYLFTNTGPPVRCPLFLTTMTQANAVKALDDTVVVGFGSEEPWPGNSGAVCFYSTLGYLKEGYLTDRIIASLASTRNGSYVVAGGYQLSPTLGRFYENGMVYWFNGQGKKIWTMSTGSRPVLDVQTNDYGSAILVDDTELLYLSHDGRILWNYSYEISRAEFANNSENVVAIAPGAVLMFGNDGVLRWEYWINGAIFEPQALAVSDSRIVAGASFGGCAGTVYLLDLDGHLIWSKPIDSAVLALNFIDNGLQIAVDTNFGSLTFDQQGNLVSNHTTAANCLS